jgi:hypothetical protein
MNDNLNLSDPKLYDPSYHQQVVQLLDDWHETQYVPMRNSMIFGLFFLFASAVLVMMGYHVYTTKKVWLYVLLFIAAIFAFLLGLYFLWNAREVIGLQKNFLLLLLGLFGTGLVVGWGLGGLL